MLNTFLATLKPMLMLFLCIAVGFVARKAKLLPENAGKVMAKMETWIFCPALGFITMAKSFTVAKIQAHATNLLLSCLGVAVSLSLAILLARFFAKRGSEEHGVYKYALTVGNGGYVGDPLVLALFASVGLGFYKTFYLPLNILIYTWGISVLVPSGQNKGNIFKKLLNAPTVGLLIGMVVGITGLGKLIVPSADMTVLEPLMENGKVVIENGKTVYQEVVKDLDTNFFEATLNTLKSCMGPVAMLLCGFTVAGYPMKEMLTQKKVYIASILRLFVLPAIIIAVLFGVKTLVNLAFHTEIDNNVLFLAFFAYATPLGLNTIVYPEAFGGNPKTGASMALISHTLCVLSIPLMFALMTAIFGKPIFA